MSAQPLLTPWIAYAHWRGWSDRTPYEKYTPLVLVLSALVFILPIFLGILLVLRYPVLSDFMLSLFLYMFWVRIIDFVLYCALRIHEPPES